MTELKSFLKSDQILTDQASLQNYGKDWTTYFDINPSAIVFPRTTEEVQKLVLWAIETKTALVPSGGRTGLSGGACALNQEVVVSFEKMNRILNFEDLDQTLLCEAGVITEAIQKYAEDKNLYYPIDFAAKGSSQIGGNVATNAGGIKVLRYGLTRNWISGLKIVTGSGEILELNKGLIKNATGYDLRQLFIGSEGTLGFVTEVTVQLARRPQDFEVVLLASENLDEVMKIFTLFRKQIELTAFEMFSRAALEKVLHAQKTPDPFDQSYPFYIVAEVEKTAESSDRLMQILEQGMETGSIQNGNVSQSKTQSSLFWSYRENISESLSAFSPYKNDIAVQVSKVPDFVKDLQTILSSSYPKWEVIWFGHIGDGNLHINILRPKDLSKEDFVKECQKVDQLVFDCVAKFSGSISAEHGVGLTKKKFLSKTKSPAEIEIMKQIKKTFDPHNICNPGKIF